MSPISRGFLGRRPQADAARVPPGQYLTRDFPVLSAGPTPHTPLDEWTFLISGAVDRAGVVDLGGAARPARRDADGRHPLRDQVVEARHARGRACRSTRCSRTWRPKPSTSPRGATAATRTNLPLEDVTDGKAWIAYEYDGAPLEPEHGGPARLLVPHLYFWKSAKWVRGLDADARRRAGVLGDATATTTTATRGESSAIRATDDGCRKPRECGGSRAVLEVIEETPHAKTIVLDVPGLAGARRRSARRRTADRRGRVSDRALLLDRRRRPSSRTVELTVERIDDGEVSPYLTEELRAGDELELRGPIGGYFNWRDEDGGPLLLIAGGSGLVPLMAMLRHRAATASTVDARLLLLGPLARGRAVSRGAREAGAARRARRALHAHARSADRIGAVSPGGSMRRC